jgi:hypothetical protein
MQSLHKIQESSSTFKEPFTSFIAPVGQILAHGALSGWHCKQKIGIELLFLALATP